MKRVTVKRVTVVGWKSGFRKVQFTQLLRVDFGYSLPDAKAATDGVLQNHPLELHISEAECDRLATRLRELGAILAIDGEVSNRKEASDELALSEP
jgi:hypothetical protein